MKINAHIVKQVTDLVCKGVLIPRASTLRSGLHTSTVTDLNYPLQGYDRYNQRLHIATDTFKSLDRLIK